MQTNPTSPELIDQLNNISQSQEPLKRLAYYLELEVTRRELAGLIDPFLRLAWCAVDLLQGKLSTDSIELFREDVAELMNDISSEK